MVSIIVMDCPDRMYLIRCLNAIRRQSLQEYEVILVGEDYAPELLAEYRAGTAETAVDALHAARGKYLMFCSMTSVLVPCTLEKLVECAEEGDGFYAAAYLVRSGGEFQESPRAGTCVYGKLFERTKAEEVLDEAIDTVFAECYIGRYGEAEAVEDAFLYESDPQVLEPLVLHQGIAWMGDVSDVSGTKTPKLAELWLQQFDEEQYPEKILMMAHQFPEKKTLHYELARTHVAGWYDRAIHEKEATCYEEVKEYFRTLTDERGSLKMIAAVCGIGERQLEYLKECDFRDYLFYYDKIFDVEDGMSSAAWIGNAVQRMEKAVSRIETLETRPIVVNTSAPAVQQVEAETLMGPVLADFVVSRYRGGALGLRTIIHSMVAWLKYKLGRKEGR